jgi:hypothetical protein
VKLQALYVVRKLGDLSVGPKLTLIWGISSVGRAFALQAKCHRFDPGILHHNTPTVMLRHCSSKEGAQRRRSERFAGVAQW